MMNEDNMTIPIPKLFDYIAEEYAKGNILTALQAVITSPAVEYDKFQEGGLFLRYFINFADACVFKTLAETKDTGEFLCNALASNPEARIKYKPFFDSLTNELKLLADLALVRYLEKLVAISDQLYLSPLSGKFILNRGWKTFRRENQDFAHLIALPRTTNSSSAQESIYEDCVAIPWQSFAYPFTVIEPTTPPHEGGVPVIFLQPIENFDYRAFLMPYSVWEVIYIFDTVSSFIQFFQFKEVIEFLLNPQATIYILALYPNEQFAVQNLPQGNLFPVTMIPHPVLNDALSLILDALKSCLSQTRDDLYKETSVGDLMYRIAKNYLLRNDAVRYGKSRYIALKATTDISNWLDPHKGLPPHHVNIGPLPVDYVSQKFEEFSLLRQPRLLSDYHGQKIRLAHVTAQLVDVGHAPTALLKNLITNADQEKFEISLIVTERLSKHPQEYPSPASHSLASSLVGLETIKFFSELGIKIQIINPNQTYEKIAVCTTESLKEQNIDIAVFHGPDIVNNLCGSMTDVPVRVLFEHGALPEDPCYDIAILSSVEACKIYYEKYKKMGIKCYPLEFSVDVTKNWEKVPYTKESLGFPTDSFIMTTISNHLNARLSVDMCLAIGTILQRCPKAYYAPMGRIDSQEKIRELIARFNVNDRVIFLGSQDYPSQMARSMELYLNEFPFGSGLGILDAMAAGCPVVSMYDENGPQQARYGGVYFGVDHVIKTNNVEDYIELACRLYNDPELYKEWSELAIKQYNKRSDVAAYVKHFESILLKNITYTKRKK